jgi:hypothetical protein
MMGKGGPFSGITEHRYFPNKDAVLKHFEDNSSLFQEAVARWQKKTGSGSFGFRRWDDNSLSWNGIIIKPNGTSYDVLEANKKLATQVTFNEAASILNIDAEELRWWLSLTEQLQLYYVTTIGTKLPSNERFIEISLRGSESGPYGLIYVPEDNRSAYELLLYHSEKKEPPLIYTKLDHIRDRWFYFEGKP